MAFCREGYKAAAQIFCNWEILYPAAIAIADHENSYYICDRHS
ncbi:MAG: hypothetical protein V7K64_30805 [Nostoc sp.]